MSNQMSRLRRIGVWSLSSTGTVVWRSNDNRIKLLRDTGRKYWITFDKLHELSVDDLRALEYSLNVELQGKNGS